MSIDPNDPLAGTPGAAGPPPPPYNSQPFPPYGYPVQYPPPYGPRPYETQADQEFQVHIPKSWTAKIGVIILGGLVAWLFLKKEIEQAIALFGVLMGMLGLKGDARSASVAAVKAAVAANKTAAHSAVVAQQIAYDVHVTKEAVRDIQNDPSKPGTPGHMEHIESGEMPVVKP